MKRLMNRLNKKGLIVRERLPGPEDSFIAWFKKLLHNKENLFPKV
jgi:DNA-binding MarR family transcriptional regulator